MGDFKDIAEAFPAIGLWIVVSGMIFSAIGVIGQKASTRAKAYFGALLTSPDTRRLYRYTLGAFVRFFDRAFKTRRIGRRFYIVSFWRSALSTLVCFAVASVYLWWFSDFPWADVTELDSQVGVLFYISFVVNFAADYVSVCETRVLLRYRLRGGMLMKVFLLALDFAMTTFVVLLAATLCNVLYDLWDLYVNFQQFSIPVGTGAEYAVSALDNSWCFAVQTRECLGDGVFETLAPALGLYPPGTDDYVFASVPFVMTTYLTSVWLWVYGIGVIGFRLVVMIDPVRRFLDFMFDAKKQPFFVIAVFSVFVWTLMYWGLLHDYGQVVADAGPPLADPIVTGPPTDSG
ncbi:MAG: hypothetical protein AAF667_12470 [Pseudomonadota bacterium]